MVSKFIKGGTNKKNVWEDGNMGQFWKEQGSKDPPGRPSKKQTNKNKEGEKGKYKVKLQT